MNISALWVAVVAAVTAGVSTLVVGFSIIDWLVTRHLRAQALTGSLLSLFIAMVVWVWAGGDDTLP